MEFEGKATDQDSPVERAQPRSDGAEAGHRVDKVEGEERTARDGEAGGERPAEQSEGTPEEALAASQQTQAEEQSLEERLRIAEARAEEAERRAAEYLDAAQRLKAEYENYRKRMLKEQTHHLEMASQRLVEALLPVLDGFDLALATLEQIRETHPAVVRGIELVYADLVGTLAKEGVSHIDESGVPFDPHIHHAVEHEGVRGENREEYVAAVLRKGYKMGRKVLRPAEVRVAYRTKPEVHPDPTDNAGSRQASTADPVGQVSNDGVRTTGSTPSSGNPSSPEETQPTPESTSDSGS